MAGYIYDAEVLPNCTTFTFINMETNDISDYIKADIAEDEVQKRVELAKLKVKTYIIYGDTNNVGILTKFIIGNEVGTLVGYNSLAYDDLILDYIIQYRHVLSSMDGNKAAISIKIFSDRVTSESYCNHKTLNIRNSRAYTSIDLFKLHRLDQLHISLKQVLITLKWYRIEDYEPPPITQAEIDKFYDGEVFGDIAWYNRYVIDENIASLIDYNVNDVLGTLMLYQYSIDEIKNRISAKIKYNIPVLSASRSSLATRILSKLYSDATGLSYWDFKDLRTNRRVIRFNELVEPIIEFETPELQTFLKDIKSVVIDISEKDDFSKVLIFRGVGYKFAKGGLHSIDKPSRHVETNGNLIIDVDADSYYPTGIVNWKIKAKHLRDVMVNIIDNIRLSRIRAKKIGDKSTAGIDKIVLNAGVFGKLGDDRSWMKDHKAMYKVTINLQLGLLMLIEQFELIDIHVISANTDGITAIVPKSKLNQYEEICNKWCKKLNFSVEYSNYSSYTKTTVNDYIAVFTNGEIKKKGDFNTDLKIDKGYFAPAIAKTLEQYYVFDNKDIDKVIRSFDIYDYCISIKVGDKYKTQLHYLDGNVKKVLILTKTNRYYVSNGGGTILKYDKLENKYHNIIKGQTVTIYNKAFESDDFDIKYSFYKAKVLDIINKINGIVTKDMKKNSGSMFDGIKF